MMYNYFVVAKDSNLKEIIHQDLHAETGDDFIPNRSIECTDCQPGSLYSGIFLLTEEEAKILKNDPRIRDVHRIPEEVGIFPELTGTREGQYDKSGLLSAVMKNWGLGRCINKTDNFGTAVSTSTPYTFNLDGTGIDVVIIDSGVDPGHPEFAVNADGTGGSRVVNYNWSQHGLLSEPQGGWLGDFDGHGSHCASIAAGNTCGWAPKAAIYSLRCIGSGRDITTGAVLGTLNDQLAWQSVRLFHLAKPIDPTTGYRRPTVVNASYGYRAFYSSREFISVYYRGNTTTNVTVNDSRNGNFGIIKELSTVYYPARVTAIDADVEACIAAGVIVVSSAGNYGYKIDIPTGIDYNNRMEYAGGEYYYHRGSSPSPATGAICVGSIGSVESAGTAEPEHKMDYSNTGPRIDIFAPGDRIMGVYRNITPRAVQDPRDTRYYLAKLNGTSMAAPQVAGVASLLLQARPWMTQKDVLNILTASSAKNILTETFYWDYDVRTNGTTYATISTGTHTNLSSLQGAVNGYLYMPFNQPITMTIG